MDVTNSPSSPTPPASNFAGGLELPKNWDCRTTTIEYIIIVVLTSVGMGPLEQSMKDIIKDQNIQNKVDSDMIQLSSLISEMETASKSTGINSATFTGLQGKLKTLLTKMFGGDATMGADGKINFGKDSDVEKFKEMLMDKNKSDPNYDPTSDPVFNLVSDVGGYLFNTTVTGSYENADINTPDKGIGTWHNDTCKSNMWDTIMNGNKDDFLKMTRLMSGNYWLKQNPGTKATSGDNPTGGEDYLTTHYNKLSGAQSALQGMGSQNTAMIQTDSSSENSLDQSGQNIIDAAAKLKTFVLGQIGH